MKELGVGMMMRIAAKGLKPRLIINENDGKWSVQSESSVKSVSYEFTPDVEFDETTADGREVKVLLFIVARQPNDWSAMFSCSQRSAFKATDGFTSPSTKRAKNQ
jgi:hypothetical protein